MMKKIFKWLDVNFEPLVTTVLFFAMTILVAGQVVLRFGFRQGFSWAEEFARYMFVWLVYLCVSYATRKNRHIKLSVVSGLFPEKGQKIFAIISDLLFFIFTVILLFNFMKVVESTARYGDMAVTLNVSRNVLYFSGAVGFLLNTIRLVQNIVWKVSRFSAPIGIFSMYNSDRSETMVLGVLQPMGRDQQQTSDENKESP